MIAKGILVTLVAIALGAAGCVNPYCGARGEPCCGDGLCAGTLSCHAGNTCQSCNVIDGPCCSDLSCDNGLRCTFGSAADLVCVP